jgi:DNA-binding SARP family transcriptional activator
VRLTVLGPVAIVVDGLPSLVERAQNRGMLARLVLAAGRPVSIAAVVESVWGGAAPPSARAQVHGGIHAIRTRLAGLGRSDVLVSGPAGYQVNVPSGGVDVVDFDTCVRQARAARASGDPRRAVDLFRGALEVWQGEPLAGAIGAFVEPARAGLVERRLGVVEELVRVELELGRHAEVVAELTSVVEAFPLRERLRECLAVALYHAGRTVDALDTIRAYRQVLVEETGIDAGPGLTELETSILRGDPVLGRPSRSAAGTGAARRRTNASPVHHRAGGR